MKILVTGGAGFIGSHTVDALLEEGYEVKILDSLAPPVHAEGHVPDYVPLSDVEFIFGDVRNRTDWEKALEGVGAVFHLAAYQDLMPDFSTFFDVNSVGTALLYEVIVDKQLPVRKVVISSSQGVYGEGRYRCVRSDNACHPLPRSEAELQNGDWEAHCPACGGPVDAQWTDESTVNPHSPYAMSKLTQEMIALGLGRQYGIPTTCLRYSIVQGPRQSFRNAYSGVLRIFTQRLLSGKAPICYEDGRQLRDYVSVQDVVRANMLVLGNSHANFEVYNVGGNRRVEVWEYARFIAQRAGLDIEPEVPGNYRYGDTRHIFSDVSQLQSLGWEPTVSLEEIVDGYIAWAQAQPDFQDYTAEADARLEELGTLRTTK